MFGFPSDFQPNSYCFSSRKISLRLRDFVRNFFQIKIQPANCKSLSEAEKFEFRLLKFCDVFWQVRNIASRQKLTKLERVFEVLSDSLRIKTL